MAVRIEADGGRVLIRADGSSTVKNITVDGRRFVSSAADVPVTGGAHARRVTMTRHQKAQLVVMAVMCFCICIFVAMILGIHIP